MVKNIYFIILVLLSLVAEIYAQLPYTFTNTARNIHCGDAKGVVVASDGTVFLANGFGGLWAFTYDGMSFSNTANIDDGGSTKGVAVASDGTIFLANGKDKIERAVDVYNTYFAEGSVVNINDYIHKETL